MWTSPPSRLLVPVDFGDASGRAIAVADALASRLGAAVHLLHAEALEVPAYFTHDQMKALERERGLARAHAGEFLASFARRHGASRFTAEIVEGSPSGEIARVAAGVDLVVMGTHGRRGPARWWLGSVAERVIRESPAPVLVVRADLVGPAGDVLARPVIVAPEGTDVSPLATFADGLARAVGGALAAPAVTCTADRVADSRASMVVLSRSPRDGLVLTHPAERWLRTCQLPMLFVPSRPTPRNLVEGA